MVDVISFTYVHSSSSNSVARSAYMIVVCGFLPLSFTVLEQWPTVCRVGVSVWCKRITNPTSYHRIPCTQCSGPSPVWMQLLRDSSMLVYVLYQLFRCSFWERVSFTVLGFPVRPDSCFESCSTLRWNALQRPKKDVISVFLCGRVFLVLLLLFFSQFEPS